MVDDITWVVAPNLIISVDTSKKQDGNLTDSGANISTSEPHGLWWSEYYMGINEVFDIADLVNTNP